ncbi:hypothetical protein SNEBB_007434 [Seison nebaliae]|nr:hypothetical protein SNEBB_007434 [Seison nebaliae]
MNNVFVLGFQQLLIEDLLPDIDGPLIMSLLTRMVINGTESVTLGEWEPIILDLVNYRTALALLVGYSNAVQLKKNIKEFIFYEIIEEAQSIQCRNAMKQYVMDVTLGKLWALGMLDSTAKFPSSILRANLNWLGDYQQCKSLKYSPIDSPGTLMKSKFEAHYCRMKTSIPTNIPLPIPDNLPYDAVTFDIGICLPEICDEIDTRLILQAIMDHVPKTNFEVDSVVCTDQAHYSAGYYLTIILFTFLLLMLFIGTVIDIWYRVTHPTVQIAFELPLVKQSVQTINTNIDVAENSTVQLIGIQKLNKSASTSSIISNSIQDEVEISVKALPLPSEDEKKELSSGEEKKSQRIEVSTKNASARWVNFFVGFSMLKNTEKLLKTERVKDEKNFQCLAGIKVFSMTWVILGHTYNYMTERDNYLVIQNVLDMIQTAQDLAAQIVIGALYAVDVFFLIAALLVTYGMLMKLKQRPFSLPMLGYYIIHRYLRLVPTFFAMFCFTVWLVPHLGEGPIWYPDGFPLRRKTCTNYWWSYLLLLNTFIPSDKTCLGFLWYVPNDFHLYCLSIIFIFIMHKNGFAGLIVSFISLILSTFSMAWSVHDMYKPEAAFVFLADLFSEQFNRPYIRFYNRASAWLIGMFGGYIVYAIEHQNDVHPKATKSLLKFCAKYKYFVIGTLWCLSTILAFTAIFGSYPSFTPEQRSLTKIEFAIWFAVTRWTFPLAVLIVILTCYYGFARPIHRFLSWKVFIIVGRLTYVMYLVHPILMQLHLYTQRALFNYYGFNALYLFIGHWTLTIFVSYLISMLIEVPFMNLDKFIFGRNS